MTVLRYYSKIIRYSRVYITIYPYCSLSFAWRGGHTHERVDGEVAKVDMSRSRLDMAARTHGLDMRHEPRRVVVREKENAPSVGNKLPTAPHIDGEPKCGNIVSEKAHGRFLRYVRRAEGPPLFGRNDILYIFTAFWDTLPSGRACHFERSREISPITLRIHFNHNNLRIPAPQRVKAAQLYNSRAPEIAPLRTSNAFWQTAHMRCLRVAR